MAQPLVYFEDGDEVVEAVYGLSGPHKLDSIRMGDGLIENASDIEFETREGWDDDTPITLATRYGRTLAPNIELSGHDVDTENQDTLSDQAAPDNSLPGWHATSTRNAPDEVFLHFVLPEGLFNRTDITEIYEIPLHIRIRKRGDTTWINLPEIHLSSNDVGQSRKSINLLWADAPDPIPSVPLSEGFISAHINVPAGDDMPNTGGWVADGYFSNGAGADVLRRGNGSTTNVQNIALYFYRAEVFLDSATHTPGFYDIEVMRGHAFVAADFDADDYTYSTVVKDFFGYFLNGSSAEIAISRAGLAERIHLVRCVSVWNDMPVQGGGFASYLFTEPTLEWFSLLPVYRDAIAGVYGLIGYNVLKRVSDASSSSTSVIEAVKQIIGGQKK